MFNVILKFPFDRVVGRDVGEDTAVMQQYSLNQTQLALMGGRGQKKSHEPKAGIYYSLDLPG